ncbi:MAG: hypothetical protein ACYS9V_14800 [Planctomycetota bacterium]
MRNRFLRSVVVGLVIFANTLLDRSGNRDSIRAMDGVQMDWRNGAV